ncbi:MAG: hypothetical protein HC869_24400 [Rhodospirillales bacterium]|nr:hypothetical protein [Rhodospirillales bacterium]
MIGNACSGFAGRFPEQRRQHGLDVEAQHAAQNLADAGVQSERVDGRTDQVRVLQRAQAAFFAGRA